jgi:hypothetical protein
MGGLVHVVYRLGRLTEKIEDLEESVAKLEELEWQRRRRG